MKTKLSQQYKNLTLNIIKLRKENNLSKKEMAQILHISSYSLNKIEKGELPPSLNIDIVFYIEKHFNIPPHKLFHNSQ